MEKKLWQVHPELIQKHCVVLVKMLQHGHPMIVTDGARTATEQMILWCKGRTIQGEPPYTAERPLGRTVTNADGIPKSKGGRGESNHQIKADGFGHALDMTFLVNGRPVWLETSPWRLFGQAVREADLEWGGDWSKADKPHIQLKY